MEYVSDPQLGIQWINLYYRTDNPEGTSRHLRTTRMTETKGIESSWKWTSQNIEGRQIHVNNKTTSS